MEKKQIEEKQIEKKTSEKKPTGEKSSVKKTDGTKTAVKKPTGEKPAVKKADGTKSTAKKPTGEKSAVKKVDGTKSTAKKPTGEKSASKKAVEQNQSDEKPRKKKRLSKKKRRAMRRKRLRIAGLVVLGCLLIAAAVFFMTNAVIGGVIYPLSLQNIDLRGQGLNSLNSVSRMRHLNAALLSDNKFEDVSPLSTLTECEYIDLTGNPVTAESYEQLRKALPDCLILCEAEDNITTELVLGGYPLPDMNTLLRVFASHKALKTVDLRGTNMPQQTGDALRVRFPHIDFIYAADDAADAMKLHLNRSADAAEMLTRISQAAHVTVTGCAFTPEEYRALTAQFPGMTIDCRIRFYGSEVPLDAEEINLGQKRVNAEMEENLRMFTGLKRLTIGEMLPSEAAQMKTAFGLEALYYSYNGCLIAPETTEIDLKNASGLNADELRLILNDMPQLKKVFMETPEDEMLDLVHEYKDRVHFVYDMRAFRHDFSTGAETLNLEGQVEDDEVEELMELIDLMHDLKQVDMYESTLSFESMDLLFDTYPDIFFGWTFRICDRRYKIRSDMTAFSTKLGQPRNRWNGDDFRPLRYCKNLQALDLGHNGIWSLDFLYEIPNLKVLILADNNISDITPLASLTELEYVELFMNYRVVDYSPLSNLENLIDLNIRCENLRPHSVNIEDFMPIKSLERLWISSGHLTDEEEQRLQEALPDCEISITWEHSTANNWRGHDRYDVIKRMFDTGVYEPFE